MSIDENSVSRLEIVSILSQLGFSESETHAYLATLELGIAPVSVIARRAKLKRPTTLEIMKKLSLKGVAEFYMKKNMRMYSVLPPKQFLEKYRGIMEQLEQAVPAMMAVSYSITQKPRISLYEGKEDLKRLYLGVLESKTEVLNYFLPEKVFEYFTEEWVQKHFLAERLRRKVAVRGISPDSQFMRDFLKRTPKIVRENKIIDGKALHFTNEIYLYDDDKMVIFSFDEDFALLIQSRDVVKTQKVIFELAWQSALLFDGYKTER
jgi:sugar-specific transcriptional regulator TrmB